MRKYIATMLVDATPMTKGEFIRYRGGNPLIYKDTEQEGYCIKFPNGYETWEDKKWFKTIARSVDDGMNFGMALELLKQGCKLKRKGWNGQNQYIELATNISYTSSSKEVVNSEHNAMGNRAIAFVGTAGTQVGWCASQADMLAEDWILADKHPYLP